MEPHARCRDVCALLRRVCRFQRYCGFHLTLSPAITTPSKLYLWALEREELIAAAGTPPRRYKSALQVYEVHSSGLKLLHTFNDNDFKAKHPVTWISKIFPVLALFCIFS